MKKADEKSEVADGTDKKQRTSMSADKAGLLIVTEFAKLVGIPASKLRYYDRKGIFQPVARGDGREKQYRYYSHTQITTIKMIRVLTEMGISLNTIKELTRDRTPEKLMKLLSKNKRVVAYEIGYLQNVFSIMDTFHELLTEGINADESDIYICEMPEAPIILGDATNFACNEGFMEEFLEFCDAAHKPKLNLSYPIGGYFNDMKAFIAQPSSPTRFFSLDPNGYERKEKGLYLVGFTRGYYGRTNNLPQRMAAHASANSLVFDGPVYNIYLFDELSTMESENYLLQAAASVKETHHTFSQHPHRHFQNAP
jgi:DNA-binding transcriptional MerR regulator